MSRNDDIVRVQCERDEARDQWAAWRARADAAEAELAEERANAEELRIALAVAKGQSPMVTGDYGMSGNSISWRDRALRAEAALRERDAEIERLKSDDAERLRVLQEVTGSNNTENPWLGVAASVTLLQSREAESRRLLEQSVETLTAAHVDCPGYEVIAAHDCHGDHAAYLCCSCVSHWQARAAAEEAKGNALKARAAAAEQVASARLAEVERWRTTLSAEMPKDFKDWWENSPAEWPEVAASCLRSRAADAALAWETVERLTRERDKALARSTQAQTEQTFLKMRELARLGREHAAEARRLLQRALAESEMPHDIHCLALPGKCWCWVKDARAHLAGGER